MALFADDTQLFYPVYSAYNVTNSSAASGWKTMDWATVEIDTTEISESSGTITTQEAGYYFCAFNHHHNNGSHGQYRTQLTSNGIGDFSYAWHYDSDGSSICGLVYLAEGWWVKAQVYHDNSAHATSNSNRRNKFVIWRFNGGTDF
tara:strand:+ start:51 stop:488 length:438 start_codon:yes stop_codon:yes gene_type:complete